MLKLYRSSTIIQGQQRVYAAREREPEMVIPEQLRKNVGFIYYNHKDGKQKYAGTCFWLLLCQSETGTGYTYTITAKHIIVKIKENSIDNKAWIRVNTKNGETESLETSVEDWYSLENGDPTDVAVISISPEFGKQYDAVHLAEDMLQDFSKLKFFRQPGNGDDVAIIGLFHPHIGKKRNIPIVRSGTIAALPEERIQTRDFGEIEAYLIESRSIGGLSGSPVYVHITTPRITEDGSADKTVRFMREVWLLGLIHGHYDADLAKEDIMPDDDINKETINMGIAIVVPAEQIMRTINSPELKTIREEELKEFLEKNAPTEDVADSEVSTK